MSGDPVEESSQQVRQGFVQALQTAHTTAALMRGRGGDNRSRAEHEQRLEHAGNREARSLWEHTVRVDATIAETNSKVRVNDARVEEIRGRITINAEAHQLAQREADARISRADRDLSRRNRLGRQQYRHNEQIHDAKREAYTGRETRAEELHALDVEYKKLLIDIRRRAAGFTETLSGEGHVGDAAASAAAFAAADAERDLSPDHSRAAEAYEQRFAEDAGRSASDVIDTVVVNLDSVDEAPEGAEVIYSETVAIDPDEGLDTAGGHGLGEERDEVAEPEYRSVPLDAVRGLAEELTAEIHLTHTAASAFLEPDTEVSGFDAVNGALHAAVGDGDGDSNSAAAEEAVELDPLSAGVFSEQAWEPEP
ncbi:hypothetical protein IU510_21090 [Nocardia cyriacigeorgica]|uniref:hypothetical protein n=1 Tax=Nocardia TaxID=1817 RepID=UPI001895BC2D|nr:MULTISPECIES: hypothetical protein [Nocardia]MBF6100557.1 hypothetical protein [Nocardia cyriacigeorgica]